MLFCELRDSKLDTINRVPDITESTTKAIIAIFISFKLITPVCIALSGPFLSELSVPFKVSPRSFARFESICRTSVVVKEKIQVYILKILSAYAIKLANITPDSDKGSVRSLKLRIHIDVLLISLKL